MPHVSGLLLYSEVFQTYIQPWHTLALSAVGATSSRLGILPQAVQGGVSL